MKIYITGHVSPDLDTIASTVEYAEFLKKVKRYEGAQIIPVRAGNPNKETEFACQDSQASATAHKTDTARVISKIFCRLKWSATCPP